MWSEKEDGIAYRVSDGFGCRVGRSDRGWFAGVQVRPDRDRKYRQEKLEFSRGETDSLLDGIRLEDWAEGLKGSARQKIVLLEGGKGAIEEKSIAEGSCVSGPAAPQELVPVPTLAWTGKEGGKWSLNLYHSGRPRSLYQSEHALRNPTVARAGGRIFVGCEEVAPEGLCTLVLASSGEVVYREKGSRPSLIGLRDEPLLLCEHHRRNGCDLELRGGLGDGDLRTHRLPGGDDLNINAAMRVAPDGSLYITHEGCGMWGYDEELGRHRDIYLWRFRPEPGEVNAAGSTANGRLPIPRVAYQDRFMKNSPPIRPLVDVHQGELVVFFRRFRFRGRRSFGWDVFVMRRKGGVWEEPARISRNLGYPDTPYSVFLDSSPPLLFNSCFDQIPRTPWTKSWKTATKRPLGRPFDTRLDVQEWEWNGPLPDVSVIDGMEARYGISPPVHDLAPSPPSVKAPSSPPLLLWADMHVHSASSKCVASMDGTIDEHLLYQRKALGCDIPCLTEHTHMMNDAEFSYMCDSLETAAPGGELVLFGTESPITGQDTILYTMDRGIFERLRAVTQLHQTRQDLYGQIRRRFEPGQVLVVRHFDSAYKDEDPDSWPATFDPQLEGLMEAMQNRGNSLIGQLMEDDGKTPMPEVSATRFLNAGKKVGLVGGSDHNGGRGPNHVCLTGIWAREATARGVWDALWNRRTIATSNGKIALWAECDGVPMGGLVETREEVRVRAWMSSASRLDRAALFRNGSFLDWQELDGNQAVIDLVDTPEKPGEYWYSVTVEAQSPFFHQPALCHSSPFFVTFGPER